MLKHLLSFLLVSSTLLVFAQSRQLVTIRGYAPAYIGQPVSVNEIEDYFSMKESPYATTSVKEDSTFEVSFYADEIQKVILRAGKNRSSLYIQPGATYDIFLPDKDKYDPYRPNGNLVEVTFYGIDSTDINYKILSFQRWMDEFVSEYYYLKSVKPLEFAQKLDQFKENAEKYYDKDTSTYFRIFVKFSIASLDNIQHAAERNRYEKHDFYIKNTPVFYRNDAYMGYINTFYEKMMPRLPMETNNRVYLGLLKSSPTLIMRALSTEYTLINLRIREMVMIKMLSEEFYSKDLPQTNILTVLDSVANHSLFKANSVIARNMTARLTELVTGGKAPDFAIKTTDGKMVTLNSFGGKHLYLHFFDPKSSKSTAELGPLKLLYDKYKDDITFVTIYPAGDYPKEVREKSLDLIPWIKCAVEGTAPVWKNYKIETYPQYVLIDGYGYVVAAPALGPMPNGQYETIDKTFFSIQKFRKEMEQEQRR